MLAGAGGVQEIGFAVAFDGKAEVGGVQPLDGGGDEDDVALADSAAGLPQRMFGDVIIRAAVDGFLHFLHLRLFGGAGFEDGVAVGVLRHETDALAIGHPAGELRHVGEQPLPSHLIQPIGGIVETRGVAADASVAVAYLPEVVHEGLLGAVAIAFEVCQREDVLHKSHAVQGTEIDDGQVLRRHFRRYLERAARVGGAHKKAGYDGDALGDAFLREFLAGGISPETAQYFLVFFPHVGCRTAASVEQERHE